MSLALKMLQISIKHSRNAV